MYSLIDSHVHLDDARFDADRAAVVARARDAGVTAQIVPAVAADAWPVLRALCVVGSGLHAAYGLHPLFLDRHRPEHLEQLAEWLQRERAIAVGECGLDFHAETADRALQRRYFRGQLRIARETNLPVVVHARKAVEEVILTLRECGPLRGVVHSYGGSIEQARRLADLGFLIGIGGPVTWPRAHRLHRLVAQLPLDSLLLETDAPDQPDAGHRGERNEPARLPAVLQCVAGLRDESAEAVAAATAGNARRLFALP